MAKKSKKMGNGDEARLKAFQTFHRAREGAALSYLRERFLALKDQPVAVERWFHEAPRIILVPSALAASSLNAKSGKRITNAIARLAGAKMRQRLIDAVGSPDALAAVAKQIGLDVDDLSLLTALTAASSALGVIAQAAKCGTECPYCHGLFCLGTGTCGKAAAHGGRHKCNLNHQWT